MNNTHIVIQSTDLEDVFNYNKIKYNTNNHWENDQPPEDYQTKLELNNTKNWIDLFHSNYKTFTINKKDLKWVYNAYLSGRQTLKFPKGYQEELDQFLEENKEMEKEIFNIFPNGAFIRSERVSLKYGCHGNKPYKSFKEIIESIVTTVEGHNLIKPDDIDCKLYFMEWLPNLNHDKEFRVFVDKNKITAISQQNIYKCSLWLNYISEHDLVEIATKLNQYFENHIKDKLAFIGSYVMDIALLDDTNLFYFIEPNSFGKEYASGSALFHWIDDYDILYLNPKTDQIVFKYLKQDFDPNHRLCDYCKKCKIKPKSSLQLRTCYSCFRYFTKNSINTVRKQLRHTKRSALNIFGSDDILRDDPCQLCLYENFCCLIYICASCKKSDFSHLKDKTYFDDRHFIKYDSDYDRVQHRPYQKLIRSNNYRPTMFDT